MMVPDSLLTTDGNLMASVDVETTGRVPGYHEIIQIAVVPLDSLLEPSDKYNPFYINIFPEYPERQDIEALRVHGLELDYLMANGVSPWRAADLFDEWFEKLDLPFQKKLMPLAHNWAFERGFLLHWLGLESYDQFWHPRARDTMELAISINDAAAWWGYKCPFKLVNLNFMLKKFGVVNVKAHDALADAIATAKLYSAMLRSFGGTKLKGPDA